MGDPVIEEIFAEGQRVIKVVSLPGRYYSRTLKVTPSPFESKRTKVRKKEPR